MYQLYYSTIKQFNRLAAALIWLFLLPVRFVSFGADVGLLCANLFFRFLEFCYLMFARAFIAYFVVIILVCIMPPLIGPAMVLALFMTPRAIKETWEMTR